MKSALVSSLSSSNFHGPSIATDYESTVCTIGLRQACTLVHPFVHHLCIGNQDLVEDLQKQRIDRS